MNATRTPSAGFTWYSQHTPLQTGKNGPTFINAWANSKGNKHRSHKCRIATFHFYDSYAAFPFQKTANKSTGLTLFCSSGSAICNLALHETCFPLLWLVINGDVQWKKKLTFKKNVECRSELNLQKSQCNHEGEKRSPASSVAIGFTSLLHTGKHLIKKALK